MSGVRVCEVLLLMLLLIMVVVSAEGTELSATETRQNLMKSLDREGYLATFRHGQGLKRGMSAYLWDNRTWLQDVDFHNSKQHEVLICMFIKKGDDSFADYAADPKFMQWCEKIIK